MRGIVRIFPFKEIGNDNRGVTSAFRLCRKQDDFIFITRKEGSISGNTYHEGVSLATNPKVFILLKGEIRLSYRKIGNNEVQETMVKEQSVIEIDPFVTHQIESITDIIILECNSIDDISNDRVKENVYMWVVYD